MVLISQQLTNFYELKSILSRQILSNHISKHLLIIYITILNDQKNQIVPFSHNIAGAAAQVPVNTSILL